MKRLPFVSVCTPTFNRRPFIPLLFKCFLAQSYPHDKMEWIIVDDGTDPIHDLILAANIPQISYHRVPGGEKLTLGKKRNLMNSLATGSILVYMDDDDYYPPQRVQHAVEVLTENPACLCTGSSAMFMYFTNTNKIFKFGPYGPTHATAATLAFKRELLDITRFDDNAALAEEPMFLKNYSIPLIQLDPLKTILVLAHNQNTFDKYILLEDKSMTYHCEIHDLCLTDFIADPTLRAFIHHDIGPIALAQYTQGAVALKHDVIENLQRRELDHQQARLDNIIKQFPPNTPPANIILALVDSIVSLEEKYQHCQATLNAFIKKFAK